MLHRSIFWPAQTLGGYMNCQCGGTTAERKATYRGTDMTYECCAGCGRCGEWRLVRSGEVLASGHEARARFKSLLANPTSP